MTGSIKSAAPAGMAKFKIIWPVEVVVVVVEDVVASLLLLLLSKSDAVGIRGSRSVGCCCCSVILMLVVE